jgi:hypothetical protein
LDLNTRAGREHLRIDVEVANELMVRYGDAHAAHRPALQRPYRQHCITALSATISAQHRVTALQIRAAEQDRNWWADAFLVLLPMALLALFVTSHVTRRIRQSFDNEDRAIAAVSAGGVSGGGCETYHFIAAAPIGRQDILPDLAIQLIRTTAGQAARAEVILVF